jgi:hypothetical protein
MKNSYKILLEKLNFVGICSGEIIPNYRSILQLEPGFITKQQSLLTLQSPVVTICTTCFNILKLYVLRTECINVFHVVLMINRDGFSKQHPPTGPCSRDTCFL